MSEYSVTYGSLLAIGDCLEMRDGRILRVIALEGKTAMGSQWYRVREHSPEPICTENVQDRP